MSYREEYQGFVPVSVYLPGQRVDGRAWKYANRRLLQQIEEDSRQFIPLTEARVYALTGEESRLVGEFDVLAVSKAAIAAIEPKDSVTPSSPPALEPTRTECA